MATCEPGCTCRRHLGLNRGSKRPDLAARNLTEAARTRPRTISGEARARMAAERTIHGHARKRGERGGTKTYYVWAAMVQRCTNPNSKDWKHYGARGITVCERWHSFANFLADMGEKPDGLMIERRDNDGSYCPENCYWADTITQARNKRRAAPPARNPDGTFA